MYWKSLSYEEIKNRVFDALKENVNYRTQPILGLPGTFLDQEEFYDDAPFLQNAPFLKTFIENPNHIGVHTLTQFEDVFKGTQHLEVEVIKLIAEQIFQGEPEQHDGYIASGGTEANIEAMWIYRNYFQKELGADLSEIAMIYSEDSHYSMPKGANILGVDSIILKVNTETREIIFEDLESKILEAEKKEKKYFIVIVNLSTTMYGSVDNITKISEFLDTRNIEYKVHIDAAFGGFIYPFTNPDSIFNFKNPKITSITIDGHKMLQSPYGTGIFIIRKGYMHYALTNEAQYVQGKDYTICGSRSGANAVAVWIILMHHGSDGWKVKMQKLNSLTSKVCSRLDKLGVEYYRNPFINIIAIKSKYISKELGKKYHLVADTYEHEPNWWKIVMMAHVKPGTLDLFLSELETSLLAN